MVAAEVLEEERKKKSDAEAAELALKQELEAEQGESVTIKKKKRGPMIAS